MLLLLLCFHVHYELLNCEEKVTAKFNESSLVDHNRQKLLQVSDLLEDLEDKTKKLLVLLADVQPYATIRDTNNIMTTVISGKDQNNLDPKNSTTPTLVPHSIARAGAPTSAISLEPYVTLQPRVPHFSFKIMLSTYPGLQISPSSLSEKGSGLRTPSFLSSLSTTGPWSKIQQVSSTPVTTPSSTMKTTPLGRLARGWLDEIAPYTKVRKKIRKGLRSKSRPSVLIPLNMTLAKRVSRPRKTLGYSYKAWMTTRTTAGDMLYGKVKVQTTLPPNQGYQELMKQLDEGYLVVFGIEMFRLIAVKDKRDVRAVLAPVESIYKTSLQSYGLLEADNPFLTSFGKLVTMISKDDIDTLRTYSSMMFHKLLQRKKALSPKVNSMIDQAGFSYTDAEGRRLLRTLTEFGNYPNTTKSSFSICENLVEGILQPFQRPADSKSRHKLLSSINKALRQNYPQLLGDRGGGTPTTLSLIGTTISNIGIRSRRKRKKKRRLKLGNYSDNTRPTRQYLDYHQPGFIEAITTKSYRRKSSRRRQMPSYGVNRGRKMPSYGVNRGRKMPSYGVNRGRQMPSYGVNRGQKMPSYGVNTGRKKSL